MRILCRQVAAVLAFVSGYSKDRVGLILYSDVIECLVPPALGHTHVHTVLERIFSHEPRSKLTNGAVALECLKQMKNRNAAVFIISDCIDDHLDSALKLASRMYEIVTIRCLDAAERHLPCACFLPVSDPETGKKCVLDTRFCKCRRVANYLEERISEQKKLYAKYGIDCLDLVNNETFIGEVVRFFRRRMTY